MGSFYSWLIKNPPRWLKSASSYQIIWAFYLKNDNIVAMNFLKHPNQLNDPLISIHKNKNYYSNEMSLWKTPFCHSVKSYNEPCLRWLINERLNRQKHMQQHHGMDFDLRYFLTAIPYEEYRLSHKKNW